MAAAPLHRLWGFHHHRDDASDDRRPLSCSGQPYLSITLVPGQTPGAHPDAIAVHISPDPFSTSDSALVDDAATPAGRHVRRERREAPLRLVELAAPDERCVCGHRALAHRPSAVAPFGRGLCYPNTCVCRVLRLPDLEPPEPAYLMVPDARFALVVHRGLTPDGGIFRAPERIKMVPTVSTNVAWAVGHTLVDHDRRQRPHLYIDWRGGPTHGVYRDFVRITGHGCNCGVITHTYQRPDIVAEMSPVLGWVNRNTTPIDWCELVPVGQQQSG